MASDSMNVLTISRTLLAAITAATLAVSGCAHKRPVQTGAKVPSSEIKVYDSTELLRSQYTLVQHVWIDSWRTNVTYPSFGTPDEGMNAMKQVASDAGANALVHVICVDGTRTNKPTKLYCYGDAVRVN